MLPDIEFGMVEYISSFYPHNTVDLAIIQNAFGPFRPAHQRTFGSY